MITSGNKKKEYIRFNKRFYLFLTVAVVTVFYLIILCTSSVQVQNNDVVPSVVDSGIATSSPTLEKTESSSENQSNIEDIASSESTSDVITNSDVVNDVASDVASDVTSATSLPVVTEKPKHKYYDVPLLEDLQDYIFELAEEYGVPAGLIFAIAETESSFRPDVISKTNDYGLCQINKVNHEWLKEELGLDNMLDPYQNVKACIHIYSDLLKDSDGDINLACMCYNCGTAGARRLWKQGIYSTSYSRKIINLYESKYA